MHQPSLLSPRGGYPSSAHLIQNSNHKRSRSDFETPTYRASQSGANGRVYQRALIMDAVKGGSNGNNLYEDGRSQTGLSTSTRMQPLLNPKGQYVIIGDHSSTPLQSIAATSESDNQISPLVTTRGLDHQTQAPTGWSPKLEYMPSWVQQHPTMSTAGRVQQSISYTVIPLPKRKTYTCTKCGKAKLGHKCTFNSRPKEDNQQGYASPHATHSHVLGSRNEPTHQFGVANPLPQRHAPQPLIMHHSRITGALQPQSQFMAPLILPLHSGSVPPQEALSGAPPYHLPATAPAPTIENAGLQHLLRPAALSWAPVVGQGPQGRGAHAPALSFGASRFTVG
jgi:hypothetical protein